MTPEQTLRERLAEIEHEQWMAWSKNIAETETITPERLSRWQKLWVPYSELSEPSKDQDREWADKVLAQFDVMLAEDIEKGKIKMKNRNEYIIDSMGRKHKCPKNIGYNEGSMYVLSILEARRLSLKK